ncbi:MAG: CapA family protein [Clostridia bacterium]|nr:CapA family protein [Clostridia bacterium]
MRRILCGICALISAFSFSGCALLAEDPPFRVYETDRLQSTPETTGTISADQPSAPVISPVTDPFLGVEITFLAVGDNLIHPNIYMDAKKRGTAEKTYDFLPMYADVADAVAGADFSFINQETVMAGEDYGYQGYPTFNSPQQLGLDLVSLGFDIVNIANNHMLDMGTDGLLDTVAFWRGQPVALIGADEILPDPVYLEKDGVTIALLSYTYSTNGFVLQKDKGIGIPYIDEERILTDIGRAADSADAVIVSVHWGVENSHIPTEEQTHLAAAMAGAGADVILGHHSHCLQPIEWIEGTNGHRTLCIYSLGNFVSGMAAPLNQVSGLFTFSLVSDGNGGICADAPLFQPTVFYYGSNWFDTHLYMLEDYTEEIAARHGVSINGYTLPVEKARQIVTDVIDSQFLPDWMRANS